REGDGVAFFAFAGFELHVGVGYLAGIAGSVPFFVVVESDFVGQGVPFGLRVFEEVGADEDVRFHDFVFGVVEVVAFLEYGVGYAYLAHVVEHGGDAEHVFVGVDFGMGHAVFFGPALVDFYGVRAHAVDVGL